MNSVIVSKFGGTALADAERIKEVAEVIKSNPDRRYVVVTAPGKLTPDDIKITDLLYICYSRYENRENFMEILSTVQSRFEAIVGGLGITFDLASEFSNIKKDLFFGKGKDATASRGVYLMAKILAAYLGWEFVDSSKVILLNADGSLNEDQTSLAISNVLQKVQHAIIPGGFGIVPNTQKLLMSKGGGDATGAVIAKAIKADVFEKWTEHRHIYIADPSIVQNPAKIRNLTYSELIELTYMGINVVHEDVLLMLKNIGVLTNIRSIHYPNDEGTYISATLPEGTDRKVAACVSGRRNFKMLRIEKMGLNKLHGIGEKVFGAFARRGISCEHYVSGIYHFAVVLKNPMFDIRRQEILNDISNAIKPDSITIEKNLSLVAVIGEGMGTTKGIFAKIFDAIAAADVKVRLTDQGADDLNIIIGVYDEDFEKTVNAVYQAVI
ncbi:MAG: aspartate kinase [Synergistaceae bacterium]|nr:aspartate kinase [Synergistaceae bacterium]MBR0094008.1 aspartate kinase [Synergistaceae bacterium]